MGGKGQKRKKRLKGGKGSLIPARNLSEGQKFIPFRDGE